MRSGLVIVGLVMVVLGVLWTFQGLGYIDGSPTTGQAFWATVGPIVAGFGVALVWVVWRRPRS